MIKKLPQTLLSWCYRIGGLLVVIGAAMPIFNDETYLTPYVFSLGALLFAAAQLLTPMPDLNITVKRLVWQQRLGALLIMATGVLMFCSRYGISPFSGAEWQMSLAIAAVLEVYTAFRLPAAIEKANSQREKETKSDQVRPA